MFTLTRILNAPSNAPEPLKQYTTAGVAYKLGTLLTLSGGKLVNCEATDKPLFISGENAAANAKREITVYPITENMLFTAPTASAPPLLKAGDKLTLNVANGVAVGVGSASTDGVATLIDSRGALRPGDRVTVRFDG